MVQRATRILFLNDRYPQMKYDPPKLIKGNNDSFGTPCKHLSKKITTSTIARYQLHLEIKS